MAQLAFVYSMSKPREGNREKLTITEPVQDPPVTIIKDGGGTATTKPKATGFPHRFFTGSSKTKTIPLGVHFTGPEDEVVDEKTKKSRSAETSPEKEFPPWPRLLNKISRNNSMELKPSSKPRKKFPVLKKSASWAHFVEASQAEAPQHLDMEVPEQYVCDMSALFLGPKFASGSHSRVYQGVYNDLDVAVKLLRLDCCDDPARVERQFMQEVHCFSQLSHPSIVRFVAASWKPPVCCLIMEYVPGGSLRAFLRKTSRVPMKTILSMARDVACGMEYLHSQGIVHRDLKSANLLLTEDLRVKVTDFGVGCMETECETPSDDAGTYRWMAPEMISVQKCSKKVDVYSFGIVLWELVTGLLPFQNMTPVQVAYAVVNKNLRPRVPDDCPAALRFLMEDCWLANPEHRPNFLQIVQTLEDLDKAWTQEPYHQQYAKSILFG